MSPSTSPTQFHLLLQPVHVRNWELQIQFRVTGTTKDLFGDGFAIWYTRDRMQTGPVFGSRDYFSGLAIIADTYSNHNGPHNVIKKSYIMYCQANT